MSKKSAKKIKRRQYKKPAAAPHKPLPQKTKILIAVIVGALAIGGLLFGLLYDDGSLKIANDAIVGAEESWLIVNRGTNSSDKAKYYKLAEVESAVEGFTFDPEKRATSAPLATDFFGYPDDKENSPWNYYCVTGVNKPAAEMVESVSKTYTSFGNVGEITPPAVYALADGRELHYFIFSGTTPDAENNAIPSQTLVGYLPAKDGACVLISVAPAVTGEQDYRAAEDLLAFADKIAATITLEE